MRLRLHTYLPWPVNDVVRNSANLLDWEHQVKVGEVGWFFHAAGWVMSIQSPDFFTLVWLNPYSSWGIATTTFATSASDYPVFPAQSGKNAPNCFNCELQKMGVTKPCNLERGYGDNWHKSDELPCQFYRTKIFLWSSVSVNYLIQFSFRILVSVLCCSDSLKIRNDGWIRARKLIVVG